jgi:hypothetical protein
MIYEFHAFRVDNRGGFYGRFALASDVEAVVRSFDLMRDEIELRRIIVLIDDRPIFQRVRIGGKSEVEWTNSRCRSSPETAIIGEGLADIDGRGPLLGHGSGRTAEVARIGVLEAGLPSGSGLGEVE